VAVPPDRRRSLHCTHGVWRVSRSVSRGARARRGRRRPHSRAGDAAPAPRRAEHWRIAVGYIALLALLLVSQATLSVWLANWLWGRATRTPAQLADIVAQDLSERLAASPSLDLDQYLRQRCGRGYQPFVVAMQDGRSASNRVSAIPPVLPEA